MWSNTHPVWAVRLGLAGLMLASGVMAGGQERKESPNDPALAPKGVRQEHDLIARIYLAGIGDNALGLSLAPADETLRAQLSLPESQGLVVTGVTPNSPAAQAGVKQNDILLSLDDKPLSKVDDIDHLFQKGIEMSVAAARQGRDDGKVPQGRISSFIKPIDVEVGKPLPLKVLRGGKPLTLQIVPVRTITFRPTQPDEANYWIGVPVAKADDILRSQLGIPSGLGVVVNDVLPESPAAKAGLQRNDILLTMNDKPLGDVNDVVRQIQASAGKPVTVKLIRAGKPLTLQVTPEKRNPVLNVNTLILKQMQKPETYLEFPHPGAVVAPDGTSLEYSTLKLLASSQNNAGQQASPSKPYQGRLAYSLPGPAAGSGAGPDHLEKRLDEVINQLKDLRKAVEELQRSVKSGPAPVEGPK